MVVFAPWRKNTNSNLFKGFIDFCGILRFQVKPNPSQNSEHFKLNSRRTFSLLRLHHLSTSWVAEPRSRHLWCFSQITDFGSWYCIFWHSNEGEYLISMHPGSHLIFFKLWMWGGKKNWSGRMSFHRWLGVWISLHGFLPLSIKWDSYRALYWALAHCCPQLCWFCSLSLLSLWVLARSRQLFSN